MPKARRTRNFNVAVSPTYQDKLRILVTATNEANPHCQLSEEDVIAKAAAYGINEMVVALCAKDHSFYGKFNLAVLQDCEGKKNIVQEVASLLD